MEMKYPKKQFVLKYKKIKKKNCEEVSTIAQMKIIWFLKLHTIFIFVNKNITFVFFFFFFGFVEK